MSNHEKKFHQIWLENHRDLLKMNFFIEKIGYLTKIWILIKWVCGNKCVIILHLFSYVCANFHAFLDSLAMAKKRTNKSQSQEIKKWWDKLKSSQTIRNQLLEEARASRSKTPSKPTPISMHKMTFSLGTLFFQ